MGCILAVRVGSTGLGCKGPQRGRGRPAGSRHGELSRRHGGLGTAPAPTPSAPGRQQWDVLEKETAQWDRWAAVMCSGHKDKATWVHWQLPGPVHCA